MGWWKQSNSFAKESELIWGDGPADIMGPALDKIFQQFQEAYERKPTEAELKAGLMFSARRMLADETPIEA